MKITEYSISSEKIKGNITIACVSDLHARPADKVTKSLRSLSPDLILLAGDIFEVANKYMSKRNENSFRFIESIVEIAPVYYCFGNHEIYYSHAIKETDRLPNTNMQDKLIDKIKGMGVNIVNDCFVSNSIGEDRINIGGIVCGYDKDPRYDIEINNNALDEYSKAEGFKILLCHYPHYYEKYLKNTDFDLIVAGHAHGGQWRIFNRGVYAPHQGLFPKFTAGIYDGRFIISTGAVNNSRPIPRFFNPTEILKITVSNNREA